MFVKVYKKTGTSVEIIDVIEMADTVANLQKICKSHSDGTDIFMSVTGIHNQAKYLQIERKYKTVKIPSKLWKQLLKTQV